MNVLLIGGGGREHALAWALKRSPQLTTLYCAPGNAGICEIANCINLNAADHTQIIEFCTQKDIQFVIIGPEAPLVSGLADELLSAGIACFGPSKQAALLEGSKGFTKDLCREAGIPTAAYGRFDNAEEAKDYLPNQSLPIVVKADGLAAGKGVIIADTLSDAEAAIDACFSGGFGEAGKEVVIEELLTGEEASFFVLTDGNNIVPLATAQDHKRVGDGDTGPNTGGMGAYSPAPIMTDTLINQTLNDIIKPTVETMANRGTPYTGVLYAGLMLTGEGPKLIEYNVRFGDPECQVLMMRLKSDLLPALLATTNGELENIELDWHPDTALTVVLAAEGYPGTPKKGSQIEGLDQADTSDNTKIFHAGTALRDGSIIANGGRVLNVTALGKTVSEARDHAYEAIGKIDWPEGFFRKDIGWREVKREMSEAADI